MRKHRRMKFHEIIEDAIADFDGLPEEQREHFAGMCSVLAACYVGDDRAVVLLDAEERVTIMAINADELSVVELVADAYEAVNAHVMEDAPPKEMMN
jgi:hypothetical protein